MAKENLILLHGVVIRKPQIHITSDGSYKKGVLSIKVLRRPIQYGVYSENKLHLDTPIIVSLNQDMIKEMLSLSVNDMVDIRGVITTREVQKQSKCEHCQENNVCEGNLVFITPIYICKREENVSPTEAFNLLKQRNEISNLAMIIGTLCREPQTFTLDDENNKFVTTYQLAVNRKYRIKEDRAENKTDYPWVKNFGAQAQEDSKRLHTGSMVYISGCMQTREVVRKTICEHCNQEYTWKEIATEIIPYSVEYLNNFKSDEELEMDAYNDFVSPNDENN